LVRSGRYLPGAPWPDGIPRPDWDVDSLEELNAVFETAGIFQEPGKLDHDDNWQKPYCFSPPAW
jgi:hypothetical protein